MNSKVSDPFESENKNFYAKVKKEEWINCNADKILNDFHSNQPKIKISMQK